jgi:hypothetical protein
MAKASKKKRARVGGSSGSSASSTVAPPPSIDSLDDPSYPEIFPIYFASAAGASFTRPSAVQVKR